MSAIRTARSLESHDGGTASLGLELSDITVSASSHPEFRNHERVCRVLDRDAGLHALIAIHDRTLGPALGGCRMWTYATEAAALSDVLRLSRAMTLKAAAAGLELGGGKAVILGDPRTAKTDALLRAFGRAVAALDGDYLTAEDVGTTTRDMDLVALETRHVLGTSTAAGDPSYNTALGVLEGMRVAVQHSLGRTGLAGLHAIVQGLGKVGPALCRALAAEGVQLTVTDLNPGLCADLIRKLGGRAVGPDEYPDVEAELFAPCALGGILNDVTIPRLRCRIVAGSANNQLAEPRHGEHLRRRGILYAPDFVVNAGGLIYLAAGLTGGQAGSSLAKDAPRYIGTTLARIFRRADQENRSTDIVAEELALDRIRARRRVERASA